MGKLSFPKNGLTAFRDFISGLMLGLSIGVMLAGVIIAVKSISKHGK